MTSSVHEKSMMNLDCSKAFDAAVSSCKK